MNLSMLDMEASDMAQALRRAGYKLTQPRLAVLCVLERTDEHLSPLEIHQRGKRVYERLGLVTVYRTLEILDELGIARRVHTDGHCHGYTRVAGSKHCLVCRSCGRVIEFPCTDLEPLLERVHERTGYLIEEHLLELRGICPDCQSHAG